MFSMFPDGWPGVGLLLLRLATGAVVFVQSVAYLSDRREIGVSGLALLLVAGTVSVLLLIGFLTRFVALAAAAAGIAGIFSRLPVSQPSAVVTPLTAALYAVIAVAIICMGAGAFSLDARLFGRREIVIPPSSHKDES
jgi:uncharacterized membrane protein YphA (DoxX/SURF4 family)